MSNFIRRDDFYYMYLEGTTNSSADTEQNFIHNGKREPWAWFPLEGNVYVPKEGIGANDIDVRSSNTSENFRILLLF
jgi:hypothetical protein